MSDDNPKEPRPEPDSNDEDIGYLHKVDVIIIVLVSAILILIICAVCYILWRKNRRMPKYQNSFPNPYSNPVAHGTFPGCDHNHGCAQCINCYQTGNIIQNPNARFSLNNQCCNHGNHRGCCGVAETPLTVTPRHNDQDGNAVSTQTVLPNKGRELDSLAGYVPKTLTKMNKKPEMIKNEDCISVNSYASGNELVQPSSHSWFQKISREMQGLLKITNRSVTERIGKKLVVFLTREVDHRGDVLILDNMNISLRVPPGAVPNGMTEYISLALNWDLSDAPDLHPEQSLVSPVVYCGPHGMNLRKRCELNFMHCAYDHRQIQITTSQTELIDRKSWHALQVTEDTVQISQDDVIVKLEHFSLFSCIMYPIGLKLGRKWIQVAVFSYPIHPEIEHYQFRIYFLNKTACALQWAIQNEAKYGAKQCCPEKVFLFGGCQGDMQVQMQYISDQWELLEPNEAYKVQSVQIWHGMCPHLSLCFKRSKVSNQNELNMHLGLFQSENEADREKIIVNLSEQQHLNLMPYNKMPKCDKHEIRVILDRSSSPSTQSIISQGANRKCIPYTLRKTLCLLLNPNDVFGNDWRFFASKLGFDSCIRYLDCLGNPMDTLLDRVEKMGMGLPELSAIFLEIDRPDAAETVQEFMDEATCLKRTFNEL